MTSDSIRRAAASGILLILVGASPLGCATPAPPKPVASSAPAPEPTPIPAPVDAGDGGWGYLIDRLAQDGVPRERALRAVQDPRFEAFDGLGFSLDPKESHALYRNFLRPGSVSLAKQCRAEYASAFEQAAQREQVPASVVAAILHVETGCGRNTGSSVILWRLSRLAMANEPKNLEMNIEKNATIHGVRNAVLEQRTRERAKYLEDLFYPEVRATFEIADRLQIDPLEIRGSSSGAFGYPQFLPTSYLRHGVDGDGDGRISLYDVNDAAASAARYLAVYGWKPGITAAQQRQVIWHYNRSDAYIETVLALAARLDAPAKPAKAATAAKRPKQRLASGGR
jgi:membrane-bound lytic murein transglycosylase B